MTQSKNNTEYTNCKKCGREIPTFDSKFTCKCGQKYVAILRDKNTGEVAYRFDKR